MVVTLLLILAISVSANADSTDCTILQIKENRIYFNCGTEEMVYPYSDFYLTDGNDTLYSGEIEFSLPGVSVSFADSAGDEITGIETLNIVIERAIPDSSQEMILALPPDLYSNPDLLGIAADERISKIEKQSGSINGESYSVIVDYTPYREPDEHHLAASFPAPFYIAMVPNLGSKKNRKGILPTSLYYHHNSYKAGLVFKGDGIVPYNRHYESTDTFSRKYEYSTIKGEKLFKSRADAKEEIALYVEYSSFTKYAEYFAIFINRYMSRARFTENPSDADIRFLAIPIRPDSIQTASMHFLIKLLRESDTSAVYDEHLNLAEEYLGFADRSGDSTGRKRYLEMADNILQTDLGVFPLFRPRIYISLRNDLTGTPTIEQNRIDFTNITRLVFPKPGKDNR